MIRKILTAALMALSSNTARIGSPDVLMNLKLIPYAQMISKYPLCKNARFQDAVNNTH